MDDLEIAKRVALAPWAGMLDAQDDGYALAMEIGENRADGEKERDIARRLGVRRGQLRMWLRAVPERWSAFSAAYDARRDELADEVVEIADMATEDTVQVTALQMKARQWWYGKDKDEKAVGVSVAANITIIHESS